MKSLGSASGEMESIELMRPMVGESGEVEYENDLSRAQLDVAVDVGPSSASRRQATVRALLNLISITTDEQTKAVLQAMAMQQLEGEGLGDLRKFFRKKLVEMGVTEPTEEEAQQMAAAMQGQQQDPNAIFLQAAAEEAQAKAAKARADVVATVADAELTQAKTVETLAKVDSAEVADTLAVLDTLNAQQPPATPPRPTL